MDTYLTVTEAAKLLGVSRTTIWTMIRDGRLSASPDPLDQRRKRIPQTAVLAIQPSDRNGTALRPWPKSIGSYDGPVDVPARDFEAYMEEHWRSP